MSEAKTPTSNPPHLQRDGFTLIEVVIALAIMAGAFIGIYGAQSQSVSNSSKTKQLNIAAMLLKNKMNETELAIENKAFNEVSEEESGQFEAPYQDYAWKRQVKEVEFPNLSAVSSDSKAAEGSGSSGTSTDQSAEMLGKLVTKYLKDATREVTVSVSWKRGKGEISQSASTYWVNLNQEFSLSE